MVTDFELKNTDSEDISDLLIKVEKSFNIKFGDTELEHIETFGQLCDHISEKIQLNNSNDCTSQQAFYKLRDAISSVLQLDNRSITTDYLLSDILPRQSRRLRIKKLEDHLGFELNILRPPDWVTWTLASIFLVSLVGLIFNWLIGLSGLVLSVTGQWVAIKIGNELDVITVGQVVEKMTRENYLKSRRNPKTFNKTEIEMVLTDWFSNELYIDKSKLTRDAKFV